jgi:hypothetical protein
LLPLHFAFPGRRYSAETETPGESHPNHFILSSSRTYTIAL